MPSWVENATTEYLKRMPPELKIELIEIPMAKRGRDNNTEVACQKEGEQILAVIPPRDHVIALTINGKSWDTPGLAEQLEKWKMSGMDYSLLIGGPDGLHSCCLQRAQQHWSISALTLPHPLVRVVLVEQLYRAWTILNNHPYHR
tara:strand:- start:381 stop:815 length:435 start_codon:yes stop_codon:yes gene_type:complete